jgi:ABC-type multidrug transport system fused ATPase/permease subunit
MFFYFAIAAFVVNFFEFSFSGLGGERLSKRLRIKSFHCILRQEIGFFDDPHYSTGVLTAKLASDATTVHSKSSQSATLEWQANYVMKVFWHHLLV